MDDKKTNGIIPIIIGTILIIPLIIFNSVVIKILWGWFISDFFGIKELTIPVAIGISILFGMFKTHKSQKQEDSDIYKDLIVPILVPIFALIFGYIVKSFMFI